MPGAMGAPAQPTSCGCALLIFMTALLILAIFVVFGYFTLQDVF
jgi:Tfp pilus assembly protein PilX